MMIQYQKKFSKKFLNDKRFVMKIKKQEKKQKKQFMKSDIEGERKNRELTENTLLTILEDTCNKLNTASQI